jgi:hypothetical protein
MVKRITFVLLVLVPVGVAYGNPCIVNPTSMAATIVVIIAALCLEIFITMGVLTFSGMALGPTFVALALRNIGSYLGVLGPLFYHFELPLVVVEVAVVAAEAVFIKLISLIGAFQLDRFDGLRWRSAFLAAILGNASSYYIGTLMT